MSFERPHDLAAVVARFGIPEPAGITPVPGGHINRSWKVVPGSAPRGRVHATTAPGSRNLLLQRLNPEVFADGALVLRNMAEVCDHLTRAAARLALPDPERRVLRLIRTPAGDPGVRGDDGAWWRLLRFIDGARVIEQAGSPVEAREAGRAFGLFQRLLADCTGPSLAETIPGFHDTARRVARLELAAAHDAHGRSRQVAAELKFGLDRRSYAEVLPPLIAAGALPTRVVHNDAKIGNVLFDARTARALAVIDLDTVMPGTLLYDVGDLIRSIASPAAEDEQDLGRIAVSRPMIQAALAGFQEECGEMLTDTERRLLPWSGTLLAYEQGVRFLTDYLEGDTYYRTSRPGQNLDRARAQFRLVELLEAEERET